MKTKESRFQVHDELTAPERSVPILKGALAGGGQLSNFLGVLAGSPAVLRAYARFRSELRHGTLPLATQQRIALAVAEHQGERVRAVHPPAHALARRASASTRSRWRASSTRATSARPRCCASCGRCSRARARRRCTSTRRRARPAGPTSRSSRPSRTWRSRSFGNLVTRAGDVPRDGSGEEAPHARSRLTATKLVGPWAPGTSAAETCATPPADRETCCSLYHHAVELVGKRWTGAILIVLMDGPLRFSEVKALVPDLSDRLLSERLKELEGEGIVERRVIDDELPVRVGVRADRQGRALEPVVRALKGWARDWL